MLACTKGDLLGIDDTRACLRHCLPSNLEKNSAVLYFSQACTGYLQSKQIRLKYDTLDTSSTKESCRL
jgi:hypothetical protein